MNRDEIKAKLDEYKSLGYEVPSMDLIKTPEQIEGIKQSSAINIALLDYIEDFVKPGVTTAFIDTLIHEKTIELGATPAPLNYEGFPKSCCISIDDQVCHGIPSNKEILMEGDIVNIDVSTIYNGYFSDSSRMYGVGEVPKDKQRLVDVTREAMMEGIRQVKPWTRLGNIGAAVNAYASKHGYTVVREIGGHGVGLEFHEEPWVGFTTKKDTGMLLAPGMVFTIEPMLNAGGPDIFQDADNGWTIYTCDQKPSAQWENTVLVTDDGCEIIAY